MSQEECEKVTAKPTAILPDKPLYKTTNPNSEHEQKHGEQRKERHQRSLEKR